MGVVDPGVGTRRRGIVVKSSQHYFIGPDNGLFSFVFNREGFRAYEILADTLPESISPTFHGRDIFAPVAAWIAAGKDVRQHLKPVVDVINFIKPPLQKSDTRFQLEVLHVDHFGNIILNFHRNDWLKAESLPNISVKIKDVDLKNVSKTFGSAAEGEIVLLWDSSDYLQIACNQGNAAQIYGIKTGDPATLHL